MLDLYVNKLGQIDTKRSFDEVFELYQGIANVYFCYQNDAARQRKRKTDPGTVDRIRDFFTVVFQDGHGQSFFEKQFFQEGLLEFFKEQKPIQRQVGVNEVVIAASKDGSFDNFLATGGELSNIDAPTSSQMDKLIKTKAQYQELLNSGKIKDDKRKETIVQNIIDIDKQLGQLSPGGKNLRSPKGGISDSASVFNPSMSPNPKNELQRFRTLKKKSPPKQKQTVEEARKAALLEIFHFYSRQHIKANIKFEEFEESMKKIDLGEFTCFTRDFKIDLPRAKLTECFRKSAANL